MNKKELTLHQIIEMNFDFSESSPEEKESLIMETTGLIMESAMLRALGDGGMEVQEKFNAFIDTDPDDIAMNEYVQKEIPKFQEYVAQEIKALRDAGETQS